MGHATVLDASGQRLSPTSEEKARCLVRDGKAVLLREAPLTIRLNREARMPTRREEEQIGLPGKGQHVLLHVCCAPCATYTVQRLRVLGFEVTGYWYNPNVHPFSEHERRRETLAGFAQEIQLPMIWEPGYEMVGFLRGIVCHERFRQRCRICYRFRLARVAQIAAAEGFDALTTTLLISPYQDVEAIQEIGEEMARLHSLQFFHENFRRGWADHFQMARKHHLYSQRYCGCLYSEWESLDRNATTYPREH